YTSSLHDALPISLYFSCPTITVVNEGRHSGHTSSVLSTHAGLTGARHVYTDYRLDLLRSKSDEAAGADGSARSSARLTASVPARSSNWVRHEKPSAKTIDPSAMEWTAGSRSCSATLTDTS